MNVNVTPAEGRFRLTWLLAILGLLVAAALGPPAMAADEVDEQARKSSHAFTVPNPGNQFWREVRQSTPGLSQVKGGEAAVLINPAGDRWRTLRATTVIRYSGWALFGVVLAILLFHVIRGPIEIEGGRSGETVERWSMFERVLHWFTAVLFVVLGLTGLTLLFGRTVIKPILGGDALGAIAGVSKYLHDYLGPPFVVAIVVTLLVYLTRCIPTWTDVVWAVKGGGFFGKSHPHAGEINAGEKFLYWIMATVGLAVCASGLFLDAPNLGIELDFASFPATRENMQLANVVHAVAAVVWMFFVLGHIYLGTAGVEGTLEGMWHGRVDTNWAKQHHDLWYEKVKQREPSTGSAPGRSQPEAGD